MTPAEPQTVIGTMTYPECIVGNEVVGSNYGTTGALIYTLGGSTTNIGTLSGDSSANAYALDTNGDVVGYSEGSVERAFIYTGGTMTDLNTLISGADPFSNLVCAYGISDNGNYIVGYGTTTGGQTHGFLLTATPEPSTLLLVATGLVGLLAWAWRKRK